MSESDHARALAALLADPGVQADDRTRQALLDGSLDLDSAYRQGRLRTDDPAAALALHRSRPPAVVPTRSRSWPLMKGYDGGTVLVTAQDIAAYAAAIDDRGSWYYGPDAIAPPMFHVRPMRDLLFAIMQDPELDLDFIRLLHGQHDARFLRPVRPGDLLTMRGQLLAVEEKATGVRVTASMRAWTDGDLAVDARSVFFVRHPTPPAQQAPKPPPPPLAAPDRVVPVMVAADQGLRYAAASLDDNPLHTDPDTARAAGLPDVILHGLCTMALAGNAVLGAINDGDPRQLRRLAVRWTRPVFNGQHLSARLWKNALGARFDVVDAEGQAVITEGIAELEEPH